MNLFIKNYCYITNKLNVCGKEVEKMIVNKKRLLSKMLVNSRLNLKADGVEMGLALINNVTGCGWLIENFNGDGKEQWFKGKMTREIVDMITEKYKEIDVA